MQGQGVGRRVGRVVQIAVQLGRAGARSRGGQERASPRQRPNSAGWAAQRSLGAGKCTGWGQPLTSGADGSWSAMGVCGSEARGTGSVLSTESFSCGTGSGAARGSASPAACSAACWAAELGGSGCASGAAGSPSAGCSGSGSRSFMTAKYRPATERASTVARGNWLKPPCPEAFPSLMMQPGQHLPTGGGGAWQQQAWRQAPASSNHCPRPHTHPPSGSSTRSSPGASTAGCMGGQADQAQQQVRLKALASGNRDECWAGCQRRAVPLAPPTRSPCVPIVTKLGMPAGRWWAQRCKEGVNPDAGAAPSTQAHVPPPANMCSCSSPMRGQSNDRWSAVAGLNSSTTAELPESSTIAGGLQGVAGGEGPAARGRKGRRHRHNESQMLTGRQKAVERTYHAPTVTQQQALPSSSA